MKNNPYSCEKNCSSKNSPTVTQFIVITGGPGAGKTAFLEFIRKVLCERIAVLPEAASILFGGGFWRLTSDSAKRAEQRAIFHIQNEMQALVRDEKKWTMGLCDRGTIDGVAYWPGAVLEFCEELHTTFEIEYSKYLAVIHLASPSVERGYNHQNPLRIESAQEAAKIDKKIHEVWKAHANYHYIESTGDFLEKVTLATKIIYELIPECCSNSSASPQKHEIDEVVARNKHV